MRERHIGYQSEITVGGITPAYAGKTISFVILSLMAWDHPRVCGKDAWRVFLSSKIVGSPPRMRERLPLGEEYADTTRITPAYAGKTYLTALQCRAYKDHPRVCGKDEKGAVFVPSPLGSPPRMRERRK